MSASVSPVVTDSFPVLSTPTESWQRALPDQESVHVSEQLLFIVLVVTIVEPFRNLKAYFQSPCTGTLIRRDLVLTTASCLLLDSHDDPDPVTTAIYERHGRTLRALKIFVHPAYATSEKFNYAVVVTEKSRQKHFPTLPKHMPKFSKIMNSCLFGGYGNQRKLILANFHVTRLNETEVTEFRCRARSNRPTGICLHFQNLMPCRGDVGSPLVCAGELVALYTPRTQSGPKCIDRYGIIFTPVYPIMEWIDRIVSAPTSNLEWMNNPWYILLLCGTVLAVIAGIYYGIVEWLQKTFNPLEPSDTAQDDQAPPQDQSHMYFTV